MSVISCILKKEQSIIISFEHYDDHSGLTEAGKTLRVK